MMTFLYKNCVEITTPFFCSAKYPSALVLLIFTLLFSGCSLVREDNKIVYHAQYTEKIEDGILVDSNFVMIPMWDGPGKNYKIYTIKAHAEQSTKFTLDVLLWHNAVKKLLLSEGKRSIKSNTVRSSFDQRDSIILVHEGYVVSPPVSAKSTFDNVNYEAYGTYEIEFSTSKSPPSAFKRFFMTH